MLTKVLEREERRKVRLGIVARRHGVILHDGEVWNGKERRGERTLTTSIKEIKTVRKVNSSDFFG